jgi:hypothetical protein
MPEYRSQSEIDRTGPNRSPATILAALLMVLAGYVVTAGLINKYFTQPYWAPNMAQYSSRMAALEQHADQISAVFMGSSHLKMWSVVDHPVQVVEAIANTGQWSSDALQYANVTAENA